MKLTKLIFNLEVDGRQVGDNVNREELFQPVTEDYLIKEVPKQRVCKGSTWPPIPAAKTHTSLPLGP